MMNVKTKKIRYWVVSPNVRSQWRELIKQTKAAIMGWPPDRRKGMQLGPKFAELIKKDDVILIARGGNANKEVIACGKVASPARRPHGSDETLLRTADGVTVQAPKSFGSYRLLDPFVELEGARLPSFNGVTNQAWAMYELRREKPANARICRWLDRRLGKPAKPSKLSTTKPKAAAGKARPTSLPTTEPYLVVTKSAAKQVARAEAKLVRRYADWLVKNDNRHVVPFSLPVAFSVDGVRGHVACDLYDEDERIMIEAKSATDRHSIRVAIGQLYDYSHLMRKIRGKTVRRAVLIPERLDPDMEEFLKSLRIASIWKHGSSFADNMSETFR
jgi:hypothetical protein